MLQKFKLAIKMPSIIKAVQKSIAFPDARGSKRPAAEGEKFRHEKQKNFFPFVLRPLAPLSKRAKARILCK